MSFELTPPSRLVSFRVSMLAVARMASEAAGFTDVDVEPMEIGRVLVTASGPGKRVRCTGSTVDVACENLIRLMWPEGA